MPELEEEEEGYDIPLDIQVEILKKLPSQSLIKFRSVSKQWKSLIDSSCFILSYSSRHTNRCILRYEYANALDEYDYLTLTDNDNEDCLTFSNQSFGTLDPPRLYHFYHNVFGNSHGLLCLVGYFQRGPVGDKNGEIDILVLWNPSIRRSVGIQLPDRQDWIARFGDFKGFKLFHSIIVGFGVCPVTMDPTIVHIIYGESDDRSIRCIALVFTLTSGAWNTILTTNLSHESIISYDPQVVIHRFIYWVAYERIDEDYRTYKLVSFDLTAKEFRVINLPDDRLTLNRPTISNLRGSLVVLEHNTPGCPCFLWMMMMEGVTPSFTRLYTINLPVTNLLGFRKTGEPIIRMQVHDDEQDVTLNVYDPHSQQFHRFRSDGNVFSFFMFSYMETLLLLDQSDGYIYSISN